MEHKDFLLTHLALSDRYICSVLDDMRKCTKTHNYSYLPSLIEEAQILATRMESALEAYGDGGWYIKRQHERREDLKKEIGELKVEKMKLKKEIDND